MLEVKAHHKELKRAVNDAEELRREKGKETLVEKVKVINP